MTTDTLSRIDEALADWERSSQQDAMSWSASVFPSLPAQQVETVRQVAHDTGLDGYAAWLVVADVQEWGLASPYARFVWPDGPKEETVTMTVTITYDRQRYDAYDRGRAIPERQRWRHRAYARRHRFFWLPCPLCGREFGGHEHRDIDGKSSVIYPAPAGPGHGQCICPACTRAGRGHRDPGVICLCRECARFRGELEEAPPKPQWWRLLLAAFFSFGTFINAGNAYRVANHGYTGLAALLEFAALVTLILAIVQIRDYHRRLKSRRRRKR